MENLERFAENVERWLQFCPEAAHLFQYINENGDLEEKKDLFAYKPPFDQIVGLSATEAKEWADNLDYSSFQLLYVYGIGDLAPYGALQEWCKSKDHFLLILEDDLAAIAHYFKSEEAHELLHAENVWLYYLDPSSAILNEIGRFFPGIPYACATIYSDEIKQQKFQEMVAGIGFYDNYYSTFANEQSSYGLTFFHNFLSNLFLWPTVSFGDALFGKLQGVPAIICGAGPSLAKNIETLKTLKEQAVIFAGGTAMNALNAAGMNPHFGVGIDPNPEQVTRIIMNSAFEVPFLYRNRMHREALNLVHSDKFYISGANGYDLPSYFEKGCGVEGKEVDEGCNVINFSLDLARAMGCNPILFVGVDLSYSNEESYAPGMQHHPIHRHFRTKYHQEEIIYRTDINGNPVPTLWKWVTESIWFSDFAARHPEVKLINCTEGGIGFRNVPNMRLIEAAEEYLALQQGIGSRLYGGMQQSKMSPLATKENLYLLCEKLCTSLSEAELKLQEYDKDLSKMKNRSQESSINNEEFKEIFQQKLLESLNDNDSFVYYLKGVNDNFDGMKRRHFYRLILDYDLLSPVEWQTRFVELERERVLYLQKGASVLSHLIQQILHEQKAKDPLKADIKRVEKIETSLILGNYSFENNLLKMEDPECNLNIAEEFIPDLTFGVYRLKDTQGDLIFESYRKEGLLHGPTCYFGADQTVVAESWYLNGKQIGKAIYYSSPGTIQAILRFKNGLQHGEQEYFYDDQTPKTIVENYTDGLLDGDVFLFHRNGLLARKQHYKAGKRDGTESLWNEYGIQIMEANFSKGNPVGISRVWSAAGKLVQEIFYNDDSEVITRVHWDQLGNLISSEKGVKADYFQQVATKTENLTQNLTVLFKELTDLVPLFIEMQSANESKSGQNVQGGSITQTTEMQGMIKELAGIEEAMKGLEEMNAKLIFESGKNQSEEFWKTSSLQKEVESKLSKASKQMQTELEALSANLMKTIESLSEVSPKDVPKQE
ncbi:MAG: motility associated factor glycosyltransferase family protein [Parachlamydiaceae bacterium]|nr:motility associated factor glycosyltransferase family protein [Parachlamydiaceae bacterium]